MVMGNDEFIVGAGCEWRNRPLRPQLGFWTITFASRAALTYNRCQCVISNLILYACTKIVLEGSLC